MDITNILNSKGADAANAAAEALIDYQQIWLPHPYGPSLLAINSDNSRHGLGYFPRPGLGVGQVNTPHAVSSFDNPKRQQNLTRDPGIDNNALRKAYDCSSCGKDFARRSDLARHERIHSGVRPHVCDYPGCGKQFIQRSALTVHARVHTGEKPHMCERCGKPFSDSSSLARHRRIHTGKRPYKCPYADCQKTFTRRTTLTRHQNHHTGTIEEAAAATAAVLATRTGSNRSGRRVCEDGQLYSSMSTPSLHRQNLSLPPNSEELARVIYTDFPDQLSVRPYPRGLQNTESVRRVHLSPPRLAGYRVPSQVTAK